jgi:DNA-binding transcriptional LysR family regulator
VTIVPRSIVDDSTVDGLEVAVVEFDTPLVDRYTALAWRVYRELLRAAREFLALRAWLPK